MGASNGTGAAAQQLPTKQNLKYTDFLDMTTSQVLRNLRFSQNQPLKSADDWYIGILQNV
jgi:hypothetical protein